MRAPSNLWPDEWGAVANALRELIPEGTEELAASDLLQALPRGWVAPNAQSWVLNPGGAVDGRSIIAGEFCGMEAVVVDAGSGRLLELEHGQTPTRYQIVDFVRQLVQALDQGRFHEWWPEPMPEWGLGTLGTDSEVCRGLRDLGWRRKWSAWCRAPNKCAYEHSWRLALFECGVLWDPETALSDLGAVINAGPSCLADNRRLLSVAGLVDQLTGDTRGLEMVEHQAAGDPLLRRVLRRGGEIRALGLRGSSFQMRLRHNPKSRPDSIFGSLKRALDALGAGDNAAAREWYLSALGVARGSPHGLVGLVPREFGAAEGLRQLGVESAEAFMEMISGRITDRYGVLERSGSG